MRLSPDTVEFVLLSFEGPDLYSLVGGLGVRVSELAHCLAEQGYRTRLYFVGDPHKPHIQEMVSGKLTYHRWCQWLSALNPEGVYAGEARKASDFTNSLPDHLIRFVLAPNAEHGKTTVVLAEDWHTAGAVCGLSRAVFREGLSRRTLIMWNANNTFGFGGIDWEALRQACAITTVSRYMKQVMQEVGVNPLVIPNGIPKRWLEPVDKAVTQSLRKLFPEVLLAKVGRYHPDKRWLMAVEALGEQKRLGLKPKMVIRGGSENHRINILEKAWQQGLVWSEVVLDRPSPAAIVEELKRHAEADILELRFFVPEEFLRCLYAAADATLANSGHEPFGLVGLEVMACGGVAFTGCTGEDYAHSFNNAVVIGSDDHREITVYLRNLLQDPKTARQIRKLGQATCPNYLWEVVVDETFRKIEFVAWIRGVDLD